MGSFRNPAKRTLSTLTDEMQRLLDDFLACKSPVNLVFHAAWRPPTDVFETDEHIVVKMDIAGVNEKDVQIVFHPELSRLRIVGRRTDGYAGRKVRCSQMEIVYGGFQREVELPRYINANAITRTYVNGFLEVVIPKQAAARTRKVPIKVQK